MFCFPSVGTVLWYIVPQKHSHTGIASDSAFTVLYKSVTRSAMDVMTEVGRIHSIQRTLGYKLILLQTGTKYFQDQTPSQLSCGLRPIHLNWCRDLNPMDNWRKMLLPLIYSENFILHNVITQ